VNSAPSRPVTPAARLNAVRLAVAEAIVSIGTRRGTARACPDSDGVTGALGGAGLETRGVVQPNLVKLSPSSTVECLAADRG
jgi:hypothetical protein